MSMRMFLIPMTLALSLFLFYVFNYQSAWITNNYPQSSSNHARIEEVTVQNVTPPYGKILMYNKVPKCGSATMRVLLNRLVKQNGFDINNIDVGGFQSTHQKNGQLGITRKLLKISQKTPVIWVKHAYFFEETRDYNGNVAWMNIIRDPIEKFISQFYFYRRKPPTKEGIRDKFKNGINGTQYYYLNLEECVATAKPWCTEGRLTITFFCGNHKDCRERGNRWALMKAIEHAEKYYSVVGINEQRQLTYALFEAYMPMFFRGFPQFLHDEAEISKHVSPPGFKKPVSNATRALMKDNLKEEYEFYDIMRQRLYMQAQTVGLV